MFTVPTRVAPRATQPLGVMASSLEIHVLPELAARFPGKGMQSHPGAAPFAIFPAVHPDVGDIEIYDDGDELTVVVGKFTHRHFSNYDQGVSQVERACRIGNDLAVFLSDLFADRIEMYGSHLGGGGTRLRDGRSRGLASKVVFGSKTYVWSGPVRHDA